MSSVGIPLDRNAVLALGSSIIDWGETFDAIDEAPAIRASMTVTLENAVRQFQDGAFVRLGSRSPKDAFFHSANYRPENGKLRSGRDAWNMLTAGSERVAEDLHVALVKDYRPWIWVREGVDMPKWAEFRCFMRDRQLVGISQYHYSGMYFQIDDYAAGIRDSIVEFFAKKFVGICHLDSVVFDVYVSPREDGFYETRLLELNPFDSHLTDPCMFDWDDLKRGTAGAFRFRKL
jgi:D123